MLRVRRSPPPRPCATARRPAADPRRLPLVSRSRPRLWEATGLPLAAASSSQARPCAGFFAMPRPSSAMRPREASALASPRCGCQAIPFGGLLRIDARRRGPGCRARPGGSWRRHRSGSSPAAGSPRGTPSDRGRAGRRRRRDRAAAAWLDVAETARRTPPMIAGRPHQRDASWRSRISAAASTAAAGPLRMGPDRIAKRDELGLRRGERRDGVQARREGDAGRLEDLGPPGRPLDHALQGGQGPVGTRLAEEQVIGPGLAEAPWRRPWCGSRRRRWRAPTSAARAVRARGPDRRGRGRRRHRPGRRRWRDPPWPRRRRSRPPHAPARPGRGP